MKSFNHIFLSFTILLNGCASFYPLTYDERVETLPDADDTILVVLLDGNSIRAEPYHHFNVTEPSDFVYGVGFNNRTSREFRGKIPQSVIDSSATKEGSLICWSRGGTTIVFREDDYVEVTCAEGTGFWCVGKYQNGALFRGRVALEDIREFQVQKSTLSEVGSEVAWSAVWYAVGFILAAAIVAIVKVK